MSLAGSAFGFEYTPEVDATEVETGKYLDWMRKRRGKG
jgi:hypothetical protein